MQKNVFAMQTGKYSTILCRYCFYSRADFGGFHPAGAIRCTDQGEIWQGPLLPAKFHLDRLRSVGFNGPKTLKNWNFTNIIAPKERVPCTILTKYIGFMRVLSLHKSAKFGCFTSINDKTINNLPRWGRFQPNFR